MKEGWTGINVEEEAKGTEAIADMLVFDECRSSFVTYAKENKENTSL